MADDSGMAQWQEAIHAAVRRRQVQSVPEGESKTKQSFRDEADVNAIMRKYLSTGVVPEYRQGQYGDFSTAGDYHTALTRVKEAQRAFDELPAHVRTAVKNDPGELLALVHDESRKEEAIALGLIADPSKPAEEEPAPLVEPAPEEPT